MTHSILLSSSANVQGSTVKHSKQQSVTSSSSATVFCPACKSTEIEFDSSLGQSFCAVCGAVLEESAVVAELTFSETATGSSVLQGQFVSSEQGKSAAPSIFGRRTDIASSSAASSTLESREATIANGRRRISQVATALSLTEHHVETASRWYKLALQHQFTRGRRSQNIVAACLYIVCRQEKTPHMLLDFSDVLHCSVYSLGGTFLRLVRLLNLEIPIVDPSFYVGRFASRLEFGDKTQVVANTALRLVARMKRDWIQVGRRPSGVCAAGLIIAARMHGFRRTERQVVQVVHICEATLRKRLDEFAATPSSSLTPEQFEGIWLEAEADPPSFRPGFSFGLDPCNVSGAGKRVRRVRRNQFPGEGLLSYNDNYIHNNNLAIPLTPPSSQQPNNSDSLSDIDDNDLDIRSAIIDDKGEIERKTAIWTELNRDFLEREAEKMAIALKEHQDGGPSIKKKRSRKQASDASGLNKAMQSQPVPQTPAEAAKLALSIKRVSKKINYEALDNLLKSK